MAIDTVGGAESSDQYAHFTAALFSPYEVKRGQTKTASRQTTARHQATGVNFLRGIAHILSSHSNLDQLIHHLLEEIERTFFVEQGLIFLTEPMTEVLVLRAGLDKTKQVGDVQISRVLLAKDLADIVAETGKPLMGNNLKTGIRNILCIPFVLHGRFIGMLALINKKGGNFTQNDQDLLTVAASFIATAIENTQLHEQLQVQRSRVLEARDQVRQELAHDLHDGPVQLITALAMRLDLCKMFLETNPALLAGEVAIAQKLAGQLLFQMRTLLFGLRPLVLETQGLTAALQILLERHQEEIPATTKLFLKTEPIKPNEAISRQDIKIEINLFAVINEAVNNALKHARAENITVQLEETPHHIKATVLDDGDGFEVDQVLYGYERRGSLGLRNIRDRVEAIGGELIVQSSPGQGTRIAVSVPI